MVWKLKIRRNSPLLAPSVPDAINERSNWFSLEFEIVTRSAVARAVYLVQEKPFCTCNSRILHLEKVRMTSCSSLSQRNSCTMTNVEWMFKSTHGDAWKSRVVWWLFVYLLKNICVKNVLCPSNLQITGWMANTYTLNESHTRFHLNIRMYERQTIHSSFIKLEERTVCEDS